MFGLPHPRITRRIDLSASTTTHSPPKDFDPSSRRTKVEKDHLPQPGSSQASTSAPTADMGDVPPPRDTFGEEGRPTSNLSQLARLFTSPERPLVNGSAIDDRDHAGPSRPRRYVLSPSPPPPPPPPMEPEAQEEDEFMGISEPDLEEMEGVGTMGMDLDLGMDMEVEVDELQRESARIVGAIDRRASKVDPRRTQLAELANRRKRRIVDSDSEPDPYPDDYPPDLIDLSREDDDHPPSDHTKSAKSGPRSSRSGGTAAWSDTPESHMPVTPHADDYDDEEDETPIEWPTSPATRGRGGGDDELARLFSSPPPRPRSPPGALAPASTSTSKSKAKGKGKQGQAATPVVVELDDDDYVPVALSPPPKSSSSAQKRKRPSPKKDPRPRASTTKAAPTSSRTNGPRKSKSIQDYIDDLADLAGSGSPDRSSKSRSDDVPQEVEDEDEYDLDPFPFPFPSSFSGLGFDVPAAGPTVASATARVANDPDRLLLIPDLPEDEQDFYMNHWRRGSNKKYPANDVVSMEELEEMADKSDARRANGVAAGRGRGAWGKRGAFARRGAGRVRGRGRARGRAR